MRYLIIGNGIAGTSAAETIRKIDAECSITVVSREETIPYSRPLISYLVSGELDRNDIIIRSSDFYEKLKIDVYLGKSVEKVDIEKRQVFLASGEFLRWDRLLVATGADPRMMDVEGRDLRNIFVLRNIGDAFGIVESCLSGAKKAAVLGGGLVGFKAAYGLLKRGIDVSIFITSPYPLSQVADERSGKLIKETLENHGLKVEVGKSVKKFEGNRGKVCGALLNDSSFVEFDLVVVAKGVKPVVGFLKESGVEINRGVVVNDFLESNISGIYAAGDVAEAPDMVWAENRINAIWPVAVEQGKIAAFNMVGLRTRYPGSLGRNVIRIFDLDFMSGGIVNPPSSGKYEILSRFDRLSKKYKKLVLKDDRLVGIALANCVEQGGVLLNLISHGRKIGKLKFDLLERDDYYSVISRTH